MAISREINFYQLESGKSPVEEFLDSLNDKQLQNVYFVLRLHQTQEVIPKEYFKKLIGTEDIWEVRVQFGNHIFRLLGFFEEKNRIILNHGFTKKTRKTPKSEIKQAEARKSEYKRRRKNG